MTTVPALVLGGLTKSQAKALAIADNQFALRAQWDSDSLAEAVRAVLADGIEVALTGFEEIDIDKLLAPKSHPLADVDDVPGPPDEPVSCAGDVWRCGPHTVVCGNSLDDGVLSPLLAGRQAAMAFTDPPYNISITTTVSQRGSGRHDDFAMASGEMTSEEFSAFLDTAIERLIAHCRDGAVCYLCMDWRHIDLLVQRGRKAFGALLAICTWVKSNGGLGSFYRGQTEFIAVFRVGTERSVNNVKLGRAGRNRTNAWFYDGGTVPTAARKADLLDHPTVKPVAMVADAIRDVTVPGDIVLDLFAGSGSTLIAAHSVDRTAIVVEIDPRFVDVILRRFQAVSGVEPVLAPDNTPLSQVRTIRSTVQ